MILPRKRYITLYHGAPLDKVDQIMKEGLKGGIGPQTSGYMKHCEPDELPQFEGLIYTSRKHKGIVDDFGDNREKYKIGTPGKTLKIKIPREEFEKMTIVDNPEYKEPSGLTTKDQLSQYYTGKNYNELDKENKKKIRQTKKFLKEYKKYHVTIKGNIDPKYIVGSPYYKK